MIADYLVFSLKSIRRRSLRSWLTILGVFIGIAAVVSLISLSQGMEAAITGQFLRGGASRIFIFPGGGEFGPMSFGQLLTEKDLDTAVRTRGVQAASPLTMMQAVIRFGGETKNLVVHGILPEEDSPAGRFIEIEKGRFLRRGDAQKVIAGALFAEDERVFRRGVRLRDTLEINGKRYEVVGIRAKFGQRSEDSELFIPLDEAKEQFGLTDDDLNFIVLETRDGYSPTVVAEDVEKNLRGSRDEKKGEETFEVRTSEETIETFSSILGIVNGVLIGIAAISLLVGAVGIMNTMFMAVLERTKEIGVMKAIGAKKRDIILLFLIESGFYGLGGGMVGVVVGLGFAKAAEFFVSRFLGTTLIQASFSPQLIFGSLFFGFFFGCVAGVWPALQAAKMNPADALRYE